jgi:hypothetical protein
MAARRLTARAAAALLGVAALAAAGRTPPLPSGALLLVAGEIGFAVAAGREPFTAGVALVFCVALGASAATLALGTLASGAAVLVVAGAVGTGALAAGLGRVARG